MRAAHVSINEIKAGMIIYGKIIDWKMLNETGYKYITGVSTVKIQYKLCVHKKWHNSEVQMKAQSQSVSLFLSLLLLPSN